MKRVKIHNDTWTIKRLSQEELDIKGMVIDQHVLGLTEQNTLTIYLSEELPESLERTTLIHELSHAYIFSYNVKSDDVEDLCDFIGLYGDEIINLTNKIL